MSTRLTKTTIDQARYDGGRTGDARYFVWDGEIAGFGLRIYPSGRKAFVLSYRTAGRKRLMTIGDYGVLTLDQARREARVQLGEVSKGGDPLSVRQKAARGETVADLCAQYMLKHALPFKKSAGEDQIRINKYLLPRWKNHKIKSIRHEDVRDLRHAISQNSIYEANRTVSLLSKMWEFARGEGLIERTGDNPARGIEKYPERKRTRWVTQEEMPRLIAAIKECESIYFRALLLLYLLTGCRKNELLTAKWEFVNIARQELNLPDTKSGEPLHLPLSKAAVQILKSLPRETGNPFIFVGRKRGQHLVNPYKVWARIRKQAGVEDVRIHDLRRTVGSWLKQAGADTFLVQHVLNQKDARTTERYMHFAKDHLRAPLEQLAESLLDNSGAEREA